MGLDFAKSSVFGDAQGQVGCGDDFNKVHEVERALARLLGGAVEGVRLMYGTGELGTETQ